MRERAPRSVRAPGSFSAARTVPTRMATRRTRCSGSTMARTFSACMRAEIAFPRAPIAATRRTIRRRATPHLACRPTIRRRGAFLRRTRRRRACERRRTERGARTLSEHATRGTALHWYPTDTQLGSVHTMGTNALHRRNGHARGAKPKTGWPPGEALQRSAGAFRPQPGGNGHHDAPLCVAFLAKTPGLCFVKRLDWHAMLPVRVCVHSVNRP